MKQAKNSSKNRMFLQPTFVRFLPAAQRINKLATATSWRWYKPSNNDESGGMEAKVILFEY
jgi:hypothetical protein